MQTDTNPAFEPTATLTLTKDLIRCASVTPDDAGCLTIIGKRLEALGFTLEYLNFGEVKNLWARRGTEAPVFCFAGHTDVVPVGNRTDWCFDPFTPTEHNGQLYGRGAADMKSGLAAMVVACERFLNRHSNPLGSIAFLLTSDEEGPSIHGTREVIAALEARHEKITWCLVGEPSSTDRLGDIIKNGRRGSLNGILTVKGKQGHVAYPHLADNPIHRIAPALVALTTEVWDKGNEFFPATSLQISSIKAGTGANNVIPPEIEVIFNFRFSTAVTADQLKQRVQALLDLHQLTYDLSWNLSGEAFLTPAGALVDAAQHALQAVTGTQAMLSTSGGTSDGRFIAPTGAQVLELGVKNATIHQVNEHIDIADLEPLTQIYTKILEQLLTV